MSTVNTPDDSNKVNTFVQVANAYKQSKSNQTLVFSKKALELSERIKYTAGIIQANFYLATGYHGLGKLEKALEFFNKSADMAIENGDTARYIDSKGSASFVLEEMGQLEKSMQYALEILDLAKKINDEKREVIILSNLTNIFVDLNMFGKAKETINKVLKIDKKNNDLYGISIDYSSLASVYYNILQYDSALYFFNQSLETKIKINDKYGIAMVLNNIAELYKVQENFSASEEYAMQSLKLREELEDHVGLAYTYHLLGGIAHRKKQYNKAIDYYINAIKYAEGTSNYDIIQMIYDNISQSYEANGNYTKAYLFARKYFALKDSIMSTEIQNQVKELNTKYETEKKEQQIALQQSEIEKKEAEVKKQNTQKIAFAIGFLFMLVMAILVFNGYRQKQRGNKLLQEKNQLISFQKELVEEKHKEITDSINYAERIQRSFLATTEMLDQHLKDYFVFFRPKDVVSGDFYWSGELSNGNFALSVADSTGHGVPGAIMSILNISSLEKSIEKETEADKILNQTRKIIIERLKKDGSPEGGKDGMDCSLLVFNQEKTQLSFAAANNPVFIVRPTVHNESYELIEFKPDKMPVGKHEKDQQSFTLHSTAIKKGDIIYALTDGFHDQFGGEKNKKYMIKNLKELLLQIAHLSMSAQEQKLAEEFDNWKGENEQVDDVCIIGVKI